MEKKPCACCKDGTPGHKGGGVGYGYNRLEGMAQAWARDNQFARSEHCVPVVGGKRFKGPRWLADKCGDGRMGFSTRRKNRDEVRMEVGLDGQFKSRRNTIISKRSSRATAIRHTRRIDGSRCGLVSSVVILDAQRDPRVVRAQKKLTWIKRKSRHRLLRRERVARAIMISELRKVA